MDHDIAHYTFEPEHDNTNKMTCAFSEDSGQSENPLSLIRVFVVRCMGDPGQRRLARLDGSESSLGAQVICWFCYAADHFITKTASLFLITSASYEHCCL